MQFGIKFKTMITTIRAEINLCSVVGATYVAYNFVLTVQFQMVVSRGPGWTPPPPKKSLKITNVRLV